MRGLILWFFKKKVDTSKNKGVYIIILIFFQTRGEKIKLSRNAAQFVISLFLKNIFIYYKQ
jgi:hypothetical protein